MENRESRHDLRSRQGKGKEKREFFARTEFQAMRPGHGGDLLVIVVLKVVIVIHVVV